MSEHEPDEIGSALRLLAADAETPPSLAGGQIRRRGEARGRRRRVVAATTAVVVLAGGAVFGVPWVMDADKEARRPVATDPPRPSLSAPVPAAPTVTVDIGKKVMLFERTGQKARSISVIMRDDVKTGRATVRYKNPKRQIPALMMHTEENSYTINASWVVELSLPSGEVLYLFADDASGVAINRSVLRVPAADAGWVYDQLKAGDTVTLK